MKVLGIHHITIASSDAQRSLDHYSGVLGLRLLKRTVNIDDPTGYHLYFGNDAGDPGSIVSVIERPGTAPGREGVEALITSRFLSRHPTRCDNGSAGSPTGDSGIGSPRPPLLRVDLSP